MTTHEEMKHKLMALGMITEASAMDRLYDGRSGHKQGKLQRLAVRVAIPSFGEEKDGKVRAYTILYLESDVNELKNMPEDHPELNPAPKKRSTAERLANVERLLEVLASQKK